MCLATLELLKRFNARERDAEVLCLRSRLQEPQFTAIDSKSAVKCIGKFFEWSGFVLDLKSEVPKLTPKWPHVFVDTYHLGKYTEVDLRSRHPTLTKEAATLSDALKRIPAQLNYTAASFRTNTSFSCRRRSAATWRLRTGRSRRRGAALRTCAWPFRDA